MQGGLKFFHSYKFWLGAQRSFYATDKYKGKKLIFWGRPSIYIANQNPLCDEGVDHDWLLGNCEFVEVTTSLLMPIESALGRKLSRSVESLGAPGLKISTTYKSPALACPCR